MGAQAPQTDGRVVDTRNANGFLGGPRRVRLCAFCSGTGDAPANYQPAQPSEAAMLV